MTRECVCAVAGLSQADLCITYGNLAYVHSCYDGKYFVAGSMHHNGGLGIGHGTEKTIAPYLTARQPSWNRSRIFRARKTGARHGTGIRDATPPHSIASYKSQFTFH